MGHVDNNSCVEGTVKGIVGGALVEFFKKEIGSNYPSGMVAGSMTLWTVVEEVHFDTIHSDLVYIKRVKGNHSW